MTFPFSARGRRVSSMRTLASVRGVPKPISRRKRSLPIYGIVEESIKFRIENNYRPISKLVSDLFHRIFEALYMPGKVFGLSELVKFLNTNPDIVEANRMVDEHYWQRTAEKILLQYRTSDGTFASIKL